MRYYLGCDPDTKNTAVAVVDEEGLPIIVEVVNSLPKTKGREAVLSIVEKIQWSLQLSSDIRFDAVAVEGQEIYMGRTKNPRSIMFLASVAGACLLHFADRTKVLYFPSPQEWKGTVPKQIHQARIYSSLGWKYEKRGKDPKTGYCIPVDVPSSVQHFGLKVINWKHIGDALGLALWARDQEIED